MFRETCGFLLLLFPLNSAPELAPPDTKTFVSLQFSSNKVALHMEIILIVKNMRYFAKILQMKCGFEIIANYNLYFGITENIIF